MTNKHIHQRRNLILAGIALLTGRHHQCRANSPEQTHLDFDDLPKNRDRHSHSPPMIRGNRKLEAGPLTATYDPEFTALRCHNISTACDTVFQIAGVGDSESNAPNTIDSCEDYSIGTHRKDESIERMRVRSLDDGPLAVGKEVLVETIVYRAVNTTGRDDPNAQTMGHFFYTSDAHSRDWSYVNTTIVQVENTATVSQLVLSATFVLQPGNGTQAVRLSYGYGEYAIHNCHRIGSYFDVDDLVFEVDHDLIRYPGFTYFATAYGIPSTPPVWNTATYSSDYRVPRCKEYGTRCDTGSSLIAGSGDFESNSPNSFTTCADTPTGTGQRYESIDRIRVFSVNGEYMTSGSWAQIFANVRLPTEINRTIAEDYYHIAHFYHLSFVSGHNHWNYITSRFAKPDVEAAYFTAKFILPVGENQMVRVVYGYGPATVGPCVKSWDYYDVDDLIFRVVQPSSSNPTRLPTSLPTRHPTASPVNVPTKSPTATPTRHPTPFPTNSPTLPPTLPKSFAQYDPFVNAPRCPLFSASCDTGDELISGVGSQSEGGPEPNAPNTIDGCNDSSLSVFQRDESIERIRIKSMDGDIMTVGGEVEVELVVNTAMDTEDRSNADLLSTGILYYASDASDTEWNEIHIFHMEPGSGSKSVTARFILRRGSYNQVIRVVFGYTESRLEACPNGDFFQDVDDLVFAVEDDGFVFPTFSPTLSPTLSPSIRPSNLPSTQPSSSPSNPKTWAAFDSHYNSPRCVDVVTSCDTGDDLIAGVAAQEPNSSNTIDGCEDFSSPSTHQVESIQRISIETVDGGELAVGKEVEVKAFVRAASITEGREYPGKKDVGSFFYAANADTKDWYFITAATVQTDGEIHTIVARFMLQPGQSTQAIRLNFGYAEYMIHSCKRSSSFYDVDDLVFDVNHDMFPEPTFHYIPADEEPYPPVETVRRTAIYDVEYTAPRCLELGSSCETGSTLVKKSSEYEQNTPNSVDECRDVSSASEEVFESIERVMVRSLNGDIMSVGSWVEVVVMVKTPNRPRSPNHHHLAHFYYKTNIDPHWKYISSMFVLTGFGNSSFSTKFKLPEGETHIIRVNYGYGELEIGPCVSGWEFMDVDDLVFSVATAPPTPTSTPTLRPSASSLTFYDSLPPSKSPTSTLTTPLESPAPTPSPTILFGIPSPGISGSNSQRNIAEYDELLKAPRCPLGSLCDSDILLLGMNFDGIEGPEPNAPNTIDSCQQRELEMDLVTGAPVFRLDESVDRIVIRSLDGDTMKAGREVEAEITLHGAEDTSSRSNPDSRSIAHVYYTPNAGAIDEVEWKYLWSESVDPGVGEHMFQVRFFLISGNNIEATTSTQAVRVNYAYAQYNANSCFDDDSLDHPYVDVDDLVFEVQEYDATDDSEIDPSPTLAPTSTSSVDCNRTGTFIYFILTLSIFAVVNEVLVA